MSMLAALKGCYDRLAEDDTIGIAPFGYSEEKISFSVILSKGGEFVDYRDLRQASGRRLAPQLMQVPQGVKRTVAIAPNFLWDKTSYALGIEREPDERTRREHEAFKALHFKVLASTDDEGLRALLTFIEHGAELPPDTLPDDVLGTNLVFQLDGEQRYLHQRPVARALWAKTLAGAAGRERLCLVSGTRAPLARLHPSIRGVRGAQSSGASIVSFNLDAFTSYGKDQGENAPVSEAAAFAYTTALNHLLCQGSRNRVQIADASTVFWAERHAPAEEALVWVLFEPPAEADADKREARFDADEAAKIRDVLNQIAKGRGLKEAAPDLQEGTRFFVLGLAPNAARIAIRFWHEDTLGNLARRFGEHYRDLAIEPSPWRTPPAIWRLLYETAVQRKAENIPAHLAGEVMRAILTGQRYPRALLAAVVMRMRSDKDERDPRTNRVRWRAINGLRAAICKACLTRDARASGRKEDVPVSLDRTDLNPGYRLGRLFSVLEAAQVAALGNVNASIRDRYYGAASATPASVFPLLVRNSKNHLKSVRTKKGDRLANWYEKQIGEIVDGLDPALPRNLTLDQQGRFAIGYYHEREAIFRRKLPDAPAELADADQSDTSEDEE
jgi:CRISPR-associated protein Csd1